MKIITVANKAVMSKRKKFFPSYASNTSKLYTIAILSVLACSMFSGKMFCDTKKKHNACKIPNVINIILDGSFILKLQANVILFSTSIILPLFL